MTDYTYNNVINMVYGDRIHFKLDRMYRIIAEVRKLQRSHEEAYQKINGLRKLGMINFKGDARYQNATDLDAHTIFTIVLYGLLTGASMMEATNSGQYDEVEEHDIHVNYTMYNEVIRMKNLEVNDHKAYEQKLPLYHKRLLHFYSKGYDFSYNI